MNTHTRKCESTSLANEHDTRLIVACTLYAYGNFWNDYCTCKSIEEVHHFHTKATKRLYFHIYQEIVRIFVLLLNPKIKTKKSNYIVDYIFNRIWRVYQALITCNLNTFFLEYSFFPQLHIALKHNMLISEFIKSAEGKLPQV